MKKKIVIILNFFLCAFFVLNYKHLLPSLDAPIMELAMGGKHYLFWFMFVVSIFWLINLFFFYHQFKNIISKKWILTSPCFVFLITPVLWTLSLFSELLQYTSPFGVILTVLVWCACYILLIFFIVSSIRMTLYEADKNISPFNYVFFKTFLFLCPLYVVFVVVFFMLSFIIF